MKNIIPVIFKHTVDMFHGTISWKIKSSFNRNFEKISAPLPVELVWIPWFQVMSLAQADVRKYGEIEDFVPSEVLIVEWNSVTPYPASNNAQSQVGFNRRREMFVREWIKKWIN